jgi:proteic killer suppression protein
MIKSFRDKSTEALFRDENVPKLRHIERVGRRKLLYLNQARTLEDLKVPPGNHLEALKGNRKGQHSIRINDQYRLCFTWRDGEAIEVEITDYH